MSSETHQEGQVDEAVPGGPPRNVRLLVACMPKSGSTYLSQILSGLPGLRREKLVYGYERREQELSQLRLREANALTQSLRRLWADGDLPGHEMPTGYVAQHHVRCSRPLLKLLEGTRIKPIVLVRNIFDVIPSVIDHLRGESKFMSMAYVGEDFDQYSDHEAAAFVADMVIPWYVNFFVSWTAAPIVAPLVVYEDLVNQPQTVLANLLAHHELDYSAETIEQAISKASGRYTRLNKGVSGRGENLPEVVKARVRHYASYYPSVDFAPIGLERVSP
ncbi:MAG: sulfotransferase domain-containing protein [Pseudomonadota bacterium]